MSIYELINKKKQAKPLSREEIKFLVCEYTAGNIPDYQMSALLMAICLKGMDEEETVHLTEAIAESGRTLDLSVFGELSADKHSTGGVGDKTTLVAAPIAAALGCKVAKMSGRGLGHTGGTVDKLESIPGFNSSLSPEALCAQVEKVGIAVAGQSEALAPADKKLYALRDVTATVDSVPLIASSVMSKKLAAGSKNIVLDVKFGSGSFMKTREDAEELASLMVNIAKAHGRRAAAFITDMNKPLGNAVGNTLEVIEAARTLKGDGPADLTELAISLAAAMSSLAHGTDYEYEKARAQEAVRDGSAYSTLLSWIEAQGGDIEYIKDTDKFAKAPYSSEITADADGYIGKVDAERIGLAALTLGAGRHTKEDAIDPTAGIIIHKKPGDRVKRGDAIATLYSSDMKKLSSGTEELTAVISITDTHAEECPLIHTVIK